MCANRAEATRTYALRNNLTIFHCPLCTTDSRCSIRGMRRDHMVDHLCECLPADHMVISVRSEYYGLLLNGEKCDEWRAHLAKAFKVNGMVFFHCSKS